MEYQIFKILHLLSVIFFMGSIFFITYVIDYLKHRNEKSEYMIFVPKIAARARLLMYINVPIVFISGAYMFFSFYDYTSASIFMIIKISLGLLVIVTFFFADYIIEKTKHIHYFHHVFHHAVISMMVLVVIFSQFI